MKRLITLILSIAWITASAQNFTWSEQTSGVTTSLNDVFFTDNQTGWVVGDQGIILKTADGGQTWASQTSGTTINCGLYSSWMVLQAGQLATTLTPLF